MKIILVFAFNLFILFSCTFETGKTISGDLYFTRVDFLRFFDAPDSVFGKMENKLNAIQQDSLSSQNQKIYGLLKFMSSKKLLRTPFIRIRKNDDKIVLVFLDSSSYDQIKKYNWTDLIDQHKKISVNVRVDELRYDSLTLYKAVKSISIDKVDGKTYLN